MTTSRSFRVVFAAAFSAGLAACAPRAATVPVPTPTPVPAAPVVLTPAPLPPANTALPPVPHVTGPLEIKVVYPTAGQLIQSKDSNFIFGSVGNGDAALTINGVLTPVWPNGSFMGWLANPPASAPQYEVVAATRTDTARLTHPIKLLPPPSATPAFVDTVQRLTPAQYATLIGQTTVANDTDRVVTGYAPTESLDRWFLLPGTVVRVDSLKGAYAFVRLDSQRVVRIEKPEINLTTLVATPPTLQAEAFRIAPAQEWVDIVIPVSSPPPYLIDVGENSLTLTFYGTGGSPQTAVIVPTPSYVSSVASSVSGPEIRYTISLRGPVFGFQRLWQNGLFTLRVRKPPAIDPTDPLRGLTIAVDPGHPPGGARGPTGFWEREATLPVGFKVRDLLQARGVNVLMTRATAEAVDLNLRPTLARRANAHALVSIHYNAVPDGMNPFLAQGTTTYHFWKHSEALATAMHQALVAQMGLPDKEVKRFNYAVVRPAWMPAVLTEGAFMMMPDQEAASRTPEYQERYARAIVEGLERYFRSLGQATR
ncbi:MAG: N-acetylmuramoyl-L-alanine amidase [Gemmatimonadota bacterium]|nr:N-acetylmuramoyl-L-alanine amidase [Gemmatimonadota bacterium]